MPKLPKNKKQTIPFIVDTNDNEYKKRATRLGKLRLWVCPHCGAKHHGFKYDICRNERCHWFRKERATPQPVARKK